MVCKRRKEGLVADSLKMRFRNGWCEGPGQCYARLGEALHCEGFDERLWHERGTADKDDCLTMKARD